MSFGFLQQAMLIGLAGIALPVIAHLLSKRKFDIVFWGAMQFLQVGRKTRRRIRLEELLLLLLRIGLISMLAVAFARPWGRGGAFSALTPGVRRDVVFVVDGSYSMGWSGGAETPHAAARQWIFDALGLLGPGDTVALLDARDQVLPIVESSTSDLRLIREELDRLSPPAGSSRMVAAAARAVQLLSGATNPVRDVVLLTDGQAYPWSADDAALWARLDDLRSQQSIKPRLWGVNVSREPGPKSNFSIDRVQLSRSAAVPGFPLRIRTAIRQFGGRTARRSVFLSVNGQALQDQTTVVNIPPDGEAPVEFEHRFASPGSYVVTVSIDADDLPGDNAAHAAVVVSPGIPVLLIDGRPGAVQVRSAAFFARAALSATGNDAPWVRATTIPVAQLTRDLLAGRDVAALLDVAELNAEQLAALTEFVEEGGGLIIAPGAAAKPEFYNGALWQQGRGLAPARLADAIPKQAQDSQSVVIDGDRLDVAWLKRFQPGAGVDLASARFSRWWPLAVSDKPADAAPDLAPAPDSLKADVGQPVVAALLNTGDPFIVTRRHGAGQVALAAAPFDSDWSTLPSKSDFVPFLHELVFSMVSRNSGRNVETGMPLQFSLPSGLNLESLVFIAPDGREHPAQGGGDERHPAARLDSAQIPGVYRAARKSHPNDSPEYFVVDFDRREADLTPLSGESQKTLAQQDRLRFIQGVDELRAAVAADAPRMELWWLLLAAVLLLLVVEVWMTRRLIRGGYELVDPAADDE